MPHTTYCTWDKYHTVSVCSSQTARITSTYRYSFQFFQFNSSCKNFIRIRDINFYHKNYWWNNYMHYITYFIRELNIYQILWFIGKHYFFLKMRYVHYVITVCSKLTLGINVHVFHICFLEISTALSVIPETTNPTIANSQQVTMYLTQK